MRHVAVGVCMFAFQLTASPASAWEYTPSLPCILAYNTGDTQVELTYDPTQPLYTITVTHKAPFSESRFLQCVLMGRTSTCLQRVGTY